MLFRPSGPCCLSVAEAPFLSCFWSQFWCFSVLQGPAVWAWRRRRFWAWKLGSFWSQFWRFSVLHCHGAFPSGSCLLNRRSSKSRSSSSRQKEKVAKKSSFSMGFRSYIRHFLVAILMLFRPSGPCCLSVAEAPFLSCFWSQFWYFSVLQGPAVWAWRTRRFWAWKLGSFWSQFCRFSVLHCHGVFPSGSCLLNFWTEGAARAGAAAAEGKSN